MRRRTRADSEISEIRHSISRFVRRRCAENGLATDSSVTRSVREDFEGDKERDGGGVGGGGAIAVRCHVTRFSCHRHVCLQDSETIREGDPPFVRGREEFVSSTAQPSPFYFWTRAADAVRGLAIADINRNPSRRHASQFSFFLFDSLLVTMTDLAERSSRLWCSGTFVTLRSFEHRKLRRLRSATVSPSH